MINYQITTNCRFSFEERVAAAGRGMAADVNSIKMVLIKLANLPLGGYMVRIPEKCNEILSLGNIRFYDTLGETVLKVHAMKDEDFERIEEVCWSINGLLFATIVDAYKSVRRSMNQNRGEQSDDN